MCSSCGFAEKKKIPVLTSVILQTFCKMECIVTIVSTIPVSPNTIECKALCQIWTGLDL